MIENGCVVFTKFSPDYLHGFGFLESEDGTSIFFSSTALYQNKGVVDQIERGDRVTFERFAHQRNEKGPAARRVFLKEKAESIKHHITTLAGELDT